MKPTNPDLQDVEFHANWKLENTSKAFKSLQHSIAELLEDKNALSIEALLFESYLYMSDFKGNEKDIAKAREKNEKAYDAISKLPDSEIKNGYKYVHMALKCWFTTSKDKREEVYKEFQIFFEKCHDGACRKDRKKFKASIYATKGFALMRLGFTRYQESKAELEKATKICPSNVEWMFMFGLITWRIKKRDLEKFRWSDEMNGVGEIMNKVLELDGDHAYAKTILADIYRRQKIKRHQDDDLVFENVNDPDIKQINDLLTAAERREPRPKIISLIAQCYIRMGSFKCRTVDANIFFEKAHNVINCARKIYGEYACILHQEAVLYREKNDTPNELQCLYSSIRLHPSNAGAKMQKAKVKALESLSEHDNACDVYDNLLSEFKDDPFITFEVNLNYAYYYVKKKIYEEAVYRNQECLKIALGSFVKNTSENGPVKFIDEQQSRVDKVIKYLRKHFNKSISKSKGQNKVAPCIENAKIHEKIGDFENACSYYREALQAFRDEHTQNTTCDQKLLTDTRLKFAEMSLKIGKLVECRNMLDSILDYTCTEGQNTARDQLQIELRITEGEKAAESGDKHKAIDMFTQSTNKGSLVGAKRLLEETKNLEEADLREKKIRGALKTIASVVKKKEEWCREFNLEQELKELLPSCGDRSFMRQEIKDLRESQLEMEYSILMGYDNIHSKCFTVLQKGRDMLNHAMEDLRIKQKQYKKLDFIIIRNEYSGAVKTQMSKTYYDWPNFEKECNPLFNYFVSIQPATNATFKWLQEFSDYNNEEKHSGSQLSSETLSAARNMCSNIEEITDKMCEWC